MNGTMERVGPRRFGEARFRAWWNGRGQGWFVWDRWGQYYDRTAPTLKEALELPLVKYERMYRNKVHTHLTDEA